MLNKYLRNEWINKMGSYLVALCSLSSNHPDLSFASCMPWAHSHLPTFFFQFLLLESLSTGYHLVDLSLLLRSLLECHLLREPFPDHLIQHDSLCLPGLLSIMLLWFSFFIKFASEMILFVYVGNFCFSHESFLSAWPYLCCLSLRPHSLEPFQTLHLCTDWMKQPIS